jgi:hypothetical protein
MESRFAADGIGLSWSSGGSTVMARKGIVVYASQREHGSIQSKQEMSFILKQLRHWLVRMLFATGWVRFDRAQFAV